jgi:hypothetical protein
VKSSTSNWQFDGILCTKRHVSMSYQVQIPRHPRHDPDDIRERCKGLTMLVAPDSNHSREQMCRETGRPARWPRFLQAQSIDGLYGSDRTTRTCAGSQIKHFFWLRYWRLEKFAFEDQHEDVVTINTLLTTFLNEDKTERRAIYRAVCSASRRSAPSNVLPNKHGSCRNVSVSLQPSEKQIRGRTHRRPCSNL